MANEKINENLSFLTITETSKQGLKTWTQRRKSLLGRRSNIKAWLTFKPGNIKVDEWPKANITASHTANNS